MQNRFVGDIGDFGKYGLLRSIGTSGLILGVNWYLTDDGTDAAGTLTKYLLEDGQELYNCDSNLFQELKKIVHIDNDRNVTRIERSGLLPEDTKYYSQLLEPNENYRQKWFNKSLDQLAGSDIIFLDPDNNILLNDIGFDYTANGCRYTFPSEVERYYSKGYSLIVYNHANRQNIADYLKRFDFIKTNSLFDKARVFIMKYNRQQVRYYLLIMQPGHREKVEKCVDEMLEESWGMRWPRWQKPHFEKLEL